MFDQIIIQHRVNTLSELLSCSVDYGVEIDIRNHGNELIVEHDPFMSDREMLEHWLTGYNHRFLIVNVKEEGLEERLLQLLHQYNVKDFFILDESIPFIRKHALSGLSNFAVRQSHIEPAAMAVNLQQDLLKSDKTIHWAWCDCFNGVPTSLSELEKMRSVGLSLCQVSPELHFVQQPEKWEYLIQIFQRELASHYDQSVWPDMVCTKLPNLWEQFFKSFQK